jgi:hypothetical protein
MAKNQTISEAVRDVCLSFPEAEEKASRGSASFEVRGKKFAYYVINHHGDGKVALQLRAPLGDQQHFVELNPKVYFVPPYIGPKGWLGVELNQGLKWSEIAERTREAYTAVAPPKLTATLGQTIKIRGAVANLKPEDIDPFKRQRAKEVLRKIDKICMALPEVSPASQFGSPVWKAGKKTFVWAHTTHHRMGLQFWVGGDDQQLLIDDPRYSIPAYTGPNGWINLDVEDTANWGEIERLARSSYRHFALKRMLVAIGEF